MNPLAFLVPCLLLALVHVSYSQTTTTALHAEENQSATATITITQALQSTFATSFTSSAPTSSGTPFFPDGPNGNSSVYNNPDNHGDGGVDTDAGASGSDSASFSISKGGLIAIVLIVVLVAAVGVAFTVLFVISKRRQITMRDSIRHVSRRLTGRASVPVDPRHRRGTAVRLPSTADLPMRSPAHKRGLVVEVKDEETGRVQDNSSDDAKSRTENWAKRLTSNEWK